MCQHVEAILMCCPGVTARSQPQKNSVVVHTHCNTLQHTAKYCNTLQHSATLCNTLQSDMTVSEVIASPWISLSHCSFMPRHSFEYTDMTLTHASCPVPNYLMHT